MILSGAMEVLDVCRRNPARMGQVSLCGMLTIG